MVVMMPRNLPGEAFRHGLSSWVSLSLATTSCGGRERDTQEVVARERDTKEDIYLGSILATCCNIDPK